MSSVSEASNLSNSNVSSSQSDSQHNPQRKMGFWPVTSVVVGSQIGSGIFLLPASLAAFGTLGLSSWLITATGAILLALIFAKLCAHIPKTGGPHTYIEAAFGNKIAFFAAWTYWVISWMSSPMVVISVVGYLTPLFVNTNQWLNLFLEFVILAFVTFLNLLSIRSVGRSEFVFTLLKLVPLVIVPVVGLFYIQWEHFLPLNPTGNSTVSVLNGAALLTLWGFIGVESATTPAGSVQNPRKTIPRAIILGTIIVALVYMLSSFSIMGVVPPNVLSASKAPFADASALLFGGNWYLIISVMASIVCLGTLNTWVLTSGQIALGASNDGHLPKVFSIKNAKGAPIVAIIVSVLGMVPILILTMSDNLISQINSIIDISVTAFLFVYVFSVLSYLKLFWKTVNNRINMTTILISGAALLFCAWALWSSGIKMVSLAFLITLSGVPVFLWKKGVGTGSQSVGASVDYGTGS